MFFRLANSTIMKKMIFILFAFAFTSLYSCSSESGQKADKDSARKDTTTLDSFGGDGTAKSKIGTTTDSTVMGTPPEKQN